MCGIVGYIGEHQASDILLDGLTKLEYRGYDSAGVAVRNDDNVISVVKTKGRIKYLKAKIENLHGLFGTSGIGHTRWATHGEPSEDNAHPHASNDFNVVAVHNGIIPFVWDTNYCGHPSGTVIDRKHLSIFNQFAYDGIMDGCASVQWPYTNDINNVIDDRAASSRCYTLTGIALDREPEKGLYIKDGRVFRR